MKATKLLDEQLYRTYSDVRDTDTNKPKFTIGWGIPISFPVPFTIEMGLG